MDWILVDANGKTHSLDRKMVSLGSDPQNDIVVKGAAPAHASLVVELSGVKIMLMTSSETCLINGKPFEGQVLGAGDSLKIGNTVFSLERKRSDVEPAREAASKQLDGLLAALEELLGQRDPQVVSNALLKGAIQLLACDGGYLVEVKEGIQAVLSQHPEVGKTVYSRSAVEKAAQRTEAFLWFEGKDEVLPTESMVAHEISAVVCNSLRNSNGDLLGVLYLHRRKSKGQSFTQRDISLFGSLCKVLSLAMDEVRIIQEQNQELEQLRSSQGITIVYASQAMEDVMQKVRRVAPNNIPVLLQGETGTGKEVAARTIHGLSNRKEKPFVAVNCGAIPENLLESELFGHVRGAFTGAVGDRKGFFEQAHEGTLLLDEIGELPLQMQVALLRVLQEQQVRRVGGNEDIKVDVRLVFSTNKDLAKETQEGRFRQDLFYRISVFTLDLPPLRDRNRDSVVLANHFLVKYGKQIGRENLKLSSAAEKAILSMPWKGNVRELENRIQRGIVNASSRTIVPEDMEIGESKPVQSLKEMKEQVEREAVSRALTAAKGNLTLAAQMLEIDRKVLRDIMKRLDIGKDGFKQTGEGE